MYASPPRPKPKVEKVCAQITEIARRLGAHSKLPTVAQLCENLAVSRGTLDSALHELETRNVVYRLHAVGIFVSPHVKKTVCLLVDSRNSENDVSPFWSLIVEAHQRQAGLFGFNSVVCDVRREFNIDHDSSYTSLSSPRAELRCRIENRDFDGFISIIADQQVIATLERDYAHLPLIALSGHAKWRVNFETERTIELAMAQLVQNGCRRIGMWHSTSENHTMTPWMRLSLFFNLALSASVRGNIPFIPHLMRSVSANARDAEKQGYLLAHEVFGSRNFSSPSDSGVSLDNLVTPAFTEAESCEPPDGIVITNDLIAQGALRALDELGIVVGRDVWVATQTNSGSPVLKNENRIIRLEYDLDMLARSTMQLLEGIVNHGRDTIRSVSVEPSQILFGE